MIDNDTDRLSEALLTLEKQAEAIASVVHWQRRHMQPLQVRQLQEAEKTLKALGALRKKIMDGAKTSVDYSDLLSEDLLVVLKLPRACS